jgi:hypothetical protein
LKTNRFERRETMLSKSKLLYVLVVVGLICLAQSAWGKGSDSIDKPWKKYNLDIGYLITSLQTDLELGAKGLGVKIDLEDAFGMDSTTSAFKLNGFWRFTDNLRHRLGLEWSSYNRDGFRTILEDGGGPQKLDNVLSYKSDLI